MEEEERGLTFSEIVKVIFKRVWWVVGAVAVCLLAAVLFIAFSYNRSKSTYTVRFELYSPDIDIKRTENKYPDGNDFKLNDLVSLKRLNEIKRSQSIFSDIDVEKMVAEDDISISIETNEKTKESNYVVKVLAKYFKNNDQASSFIRAIIERPVNDIKEMIKNVRYDTNLTSYDNAKMYDKKISYLAAQKSYIQSTYSKLIGDNNEHIFYEVEGKSLNQYREDVELAFSAMDEQALRYTLNNGHYVYNADAYKVWADGRLDELDKNEKYNNMRIADRKKLYDEIIQNGENAASIQIAEEFSKELISLDEKNSDIKIEREEINLYLAQINATDTAGKQAFDARLAETRQTLQGLTDTLAKVRTAFYEEKTYIDYFSNKVEAKGGMNLILAAAIGIIAGLLLSSIVICIIDLPRYKREKLALAAQAQAKDGQEGEDPVEKPEENPEE